MIIDDVQEVMTLPSPGSLFKKKREEFGWSASDVARELLLSVSQIEALEKDQYASLPGATYIIGYWRSYSNLLKIDISNSIEAHKGNLDVSVTRIALEPNHQRAHGHQEKSRRKSALLFCLLSAFFLTGIWYWQNPHKNPQQQNLLSDVTLPEPNFSEVYAPEISEDDENPNFQDDQSIELSSFTQISNTEEIVQNDIALNQEIAEQGSDGETSEIKISSKLTSQSGAAESVVSLQQSAESEISVAESTQENQLIQSNLEVETAVQNSEQSQPEAIISVDPKNILDVNIEQQTWLDVRDGNGEKLVYRTVESGEVLKIEGRPPFYVFIGAASGVSIDYLGQPVEFSAHKSGLFARFKIGE